MKDVDADPRSSQCWLKRVHCSTRATWEQPQLWRYDVFHFIGDGDFDEAAGAGVLVFADEVCKKICWMRYEVGRLCSTMGHSDWRVLNSYQGARAKRDLTPP